MSEPFPEQTVKVGIIVPSATAGDLFFGKTGLQQKVDRHFQTETDDIFMKSHSGFFEKDPAQMFPRNLIFHGKIRNLKFSTGISGNQFLLHHRKSNKAFLHEQLLLLI